MARIAFSNRLRLSAKNKERLDQINAVIKEYQRQGYRLTLRQLYYQLVVQNIIPNKQSEYSKLSTLLKEGRMAGVVDWDAIEDRLRTADSPSSWDSPADIMASAIASYQKPRMKGQPEYLEVWIEKDALSGVLSRVTYKYHVPICVNRGYSSASAMFQAYRRFRSALAAGQTVEILYLGDHDPSGIDMIRDVYDRPLEMLAAKANDFIHDAYDKWVEREHDGDAEEATQYLLEKWDENKLAYDQDEFEEWMLGDRSYFDTARAYILDNFKVTPIALSMAQVKQYKLPPNPAKQTDPRSKDYKDKHGSSSWEVDALRPEVLNALLEESITSRLDIPMYEAVLEEEEKGRTRLIELKDTLAEEFGESDDDDEDDEE